MMKKALFALITVGAIGTTVHAEMKPGMKQYYEYGGLRYEVLDFSEHTLGLTGRTTGSESFVLIPEEVKVSGQFILNNTERLELTEEPFTVTQINARAFSDDPDLYYVTFPSTLTDIGERAFYGCTILDIDSLPSNLESIGDYAFANCGSISKLTLPTTLSELGAGAFCGMSALQRIVMFESAITEIKESTFQNCKELEQVILPVGLKDIGDYAFDNTWSLAEIVLPEGLEHIGSYAFRGVDQPSEGYDGGLLSVTFPSTLTSLGSNAFYSAPIVNLDMSRATGLESIPDNAFYLCRNMKELLFPEGLKSIGNKAFYGVARNASRRASAIKLPSTLETLSEKAFEQARLISIELEDSVTELPANSCGEPMMLDLGAGVKNIDANAFVINDLRLIRMHSATPPALSADITLTELQKQNITIVVNDGSKSLYERHPRWRDFNLVEEGESTVSVSLTGNTTLASEIYLASGLMPSRITRLTVSGTLSDDDFKIIKENMFSLTALDISGVNNTVIPANAFQGLTLLNEMKLPKGLTAIGDYAFDNCNSMRLTKLPDGIETIGMYAFQNCASITINELPRALRTINYMGFQGCASVKSITAYENLEDFGQASFSSCDLLEYVDLSRTKINALKANALYICNLKTLLLPPLL